MKKPLLIMALAGVFLLGACSDDTGNGKDPDGSVGTELGVDGSTSSEGSTEKKKVGEACDGDEQCESAICFDKTCAKDCTAAKDCEATEECTSDDGKRLFCHTPTYSKDIGASCAIHGNCPVKEMKCLGGKENAVAYCTTECKGDIDCPTTHFCREMSDEKKYCVRRGFCTRCLHDGYCGEGKKCVKQGSETFCTRSCNQGKTECPRYAECKDVGGEFYCVHKTGSCVGDGKQCQPCITKEDCQKDALCLTYIFSDEAFCATDCSANKCGTGYKCVTIPTGPSTEVKQCVPDSEKEPKCVSSLSPMGEKGDTMQDFAMVGYIDSNNDGSLEGEKLRVVKLSDSSSSAKIILFNVSAGWCGPCQTETKDFAYLINTYGSKGLMIYQTLFDSDKQGAPPTFALLDAWIKAFKPLGAIGIDPSRHSVIYNTSGTTPLNMIIDAKTLVVLDKFNGFALSKAEPIIKQHLGIK